MSPLVLTGQPLDFASNNVAEPQPPIYLLTSGTILASVSWAVGNDGSAMAPPILTGNPVSNIRLGSSFCNYKIASIWQCVSTVITRG